MTDIVERLKSSHSMLGDPLHREAWKEIERLREKNKELVDKLKWYANEANEAIDEANLFRAVLKEIASIDYRGPMPDSVLIARKALGVK
jgi:hypothetical protein